ncbi:MAG: DUF309 domain-containing protein [Holophagales bacterium]|nr:DUF309 domain-containing protein [Holophagales bacterium]
MTVSGPFAAGAVAGGYVDFREGRFFEAHEKWEAVWLVSEGIRRRHLQGLIQLAAACVHLEKGRPGPAGRLLALSLEKLADGPPDFFGVPLDDLRSRARSLLAGLAGKPEAHPGAGPLTDPGSRPPD